MVCTIKKSYEYRTFNLSKILKNLNRICRYVSDHALLIQDSLNSVKFSTKTCFEVTIGTYQIERDRVTYFEQDFDFQNTSRFSRRILVIIYYMFGNVPQTSIGFVFVWQQIQQSVTNPNEFIGESTNIFTNLSEEFFRSKKLCGLATLLSFTATLPKNSRYKSI